MPDKLLARDDSESLGLPLEPFLAVKTASARGAAFPVPRPSLAASTRKSRVQEDRKFRYRSPRAMMTETQPNATMCKWLLIMA